MSLISFLKKLWASVKSLFDSLPTEYQSAIHLGVIVAENIKKAVDSPTADILTAIIPGDVDDKIKTVLRQQLPQLLAELKLADNCGELTEPEAIANCAIQTLQQLEGDIKSAFLHNIAILVAQIAADGKLTWSDGVYLLEWYYKNKFEPAE
ncbi:hypothetical protein C8P68_106118 [Mucilaginibacter yixingensis]|uniref:Uncharacterized protein n=1 Tax=Mucilaginibacter yixingensis TaxID=1295612 RepID=A0A2T5J6X5_9SPHI|nr:hypothetical protein [Mucilaginibacter yixingensis]PTQ94904.1 hypothetical protein C8P68_106118 [Mucilaginibacter yixingensis]